MQILKEMPAGTYIGYKNHYLERVNIAFWESDKFLENITCVKAAELMEGWQQLCFNEKFDPETMDDGSDLPDDFFVSELEIKVPPTDRTSEIDDPEEELRDRAASTTYLSELKKYLRQAKTR